MPIGQCECGKLTANENGLCDKCYIERLEIEKTALITELVFTHPDKKSSSSWQKWLDEGIAEKEKASQ